MRGIAEGVGDRMDQVAFMGDDLPTSPRCAAPACLIVPANAHDWVKPAAHWTTLRAMAGAVRDVCDLLLHAHGRVDGSSRTGEHP